MTDEKIIEKFRCGYSIDTITHEHFKDVNSSYSKVIKIGNDYMINKNYIKLNDCKKHVEKIIFDNIKNQINYERSKTI